MLHRYGMTLIELLFAIIIISITIMTIPSMMSVASSVTKSELVDEDILKRTSAELLKVSQARWDAKYQDVNGTSGDAEFRFLPISSSECLNGKRRNPDSNQFCSTDTPTAPIPTTGSKDLSQGIEQFNNIDYNLTVDATTDYSVPISYKVFYVNYTPATPVSGTETVTWRLGSTTNLTPNSVTGPTHLKAVVARTNDSSREIDMVFTFFKSNTGKSQ